MASVQRCGLNLDKGSITGVEGGRDAPSRVPLAGLNPHLHHSRHRNAGSPSTNTYFAFTAKRLRSGIASASITWAGQYPIHSQTNIQLSYLIATDGTS